MSTTHDLHGQQGKGWIGVDLDGTLAHYEGWKGGDHIGPPVVAMIDRVKAWLEQGKDVRIFTARCHPASPEWEPEGRAVLEKWMVEHLGRLLPVTCEKDSWMLELWDDRAIQVLTNTGLAVMVR